MIFPITIFREDGKAARTRSIVHFGLETEDIFPLSIQGKDKDTLRYNHNNSFHQY
jgi:hypothetical protein